MKSVIILKKMQFTFDVGDCLIERRIFGRLLIGNWRPCKQECVPDFEELLRNGIIRRCNLKMGFISKTRLHSLWILRVKN